MNEPRLDREPAERMLRGEPVVPPRLAELLAAASSEFGVEEPTGEDAAVTAFREARSRRATPPRSRRPTTSHRTAHGQRHPHPTKKPKTNPKKHLPHKPKKSVPHPADR